MTNTSFRLKNWTVGSKITGLTFGLLSVILAGLVFVISWTTSHMLHDRAVTSVKTELHSVVNAVELFNQAMTSQATSFFRIFATNFEGAFTLDEAAMVTVGDKSVPTLREGGRPLNLDFTIPDRFTRQTRGNATIFVASGDDFVGSLQKTENKAR